MVEGESFCLCFSSFLLCRATAEGLCGQDWLLAAVLLEDGKASLPGEGGREFSGHCLAPAGASWDEFTKSSPQARSVPPLWFHLAAWVRV